MPSVTPTEMRILDRVFRMREGYVLDFSNRTFAEFFGQELGIDIELPEYSLDGVSKAKRLRNLLNKSSNDSAAAIIGALWRYRTETDALARRDEDFPNAEQAVSSIISRLRGQVTPTQPRASTPEPPNFVQFDKFAGEIMSLWGHPPQRRGYLFEKFLVDLFQASGLDARGGFRVVGEQIDGSFEFAGNTYLLEAKWHAEKTPASDLRSFTGKIGERMPWTRGLFVSYTGFSEDGLEAFGRGKPIVCMSGEDIHTALTRRISLDKVLNAKLRRGSETGQIFVPVRELFP